MRIDKLSAAAVVGLLSGLVLAQASATLGNMRQLGRSTTAALLASSSAIQGGIIFDLDAGLPKFNTGAAWSVFDPPTDAGLFVSWSGDGGAAVLASSDGGQLQLVSDNPGTIASVYVNAPISVATYGYQPGPPTPFYISGARFALVDAGTAAGTTQARFTATGSDGGTCSCFFPCNSADAGAVAVAANCLGICAFPAAEPLTYGFSTVGDCATTPKVKGNVTVEGRFGSVANTDAGPPPAGTAITFVAAGTFASAGSGGVSLSISPGIPAGIANNDILVLMVAWGIAGSNYTGTPTGYTALTAGNYMRFFWKRTTGTESAPTITMSGNAALAARIFAYRGCTTSGSPVDVQSTADDETSPLPSVTTVTANTHVIFALSPSSTLGANPAVAGVAGPATTSEGNSESGELFSDDCCVSFWLGIHLYGDTKAAAGATGNATWTSPTTGNAAGYFLALKP